MIASLLYIITWCIYSTNVIYGEYLIKEDTVPSSLYRKFDNIEDDFFPRDIRFKLSLSKISGMLLYSIDKHLHQVIVLLQDGITSNIVIEINTQREYVSIPEICGCTMCLYQTLDLRIQILKDIRIQCNGRDVKYVTYKNNTDIDDDYPILYSKIKDGPILSNEAHLWLVNFQEKYYQHVKSEQLSGCIFSATINGHEIITNIEEKCPKSCHNDVCHGGLCHETYMDIPDCDCTRTFLNGPLCNDSISPINIQSINQDFVLQLFKVSWMSSEEEILKFDNRLIKIGLFRKNSVLSFEYIYQNGFDAVIKRTLTSSYVEKRKYILIVNFTETNINFEFYDNGSWIKAFMPISRKLNKEKFKSLLLRSGDGDIDLVYKSNDKDYKWKRISVPEYETIKYDSSHKSTKTNMELSFPTTIQSIIYNETKKDCQIYWSIIIPIIVLLLVGLIVAVILAVIFKHSPNCRRRCQKNWEEEEEIIRDSRQPHNDSTYIHKYDISRLDYPNSNIFKVFDKTNYLNDRNYVPHVEDSPSIAMTISDDSGLYNTDVEDNESTYSQGTEDMECTKCKVRQILLNAIDEDHLENIIPAEVNNELLNKTVKSGQDKGSTPYKIFEVDPQYDSEY